MAFKKFTRHFGRNFVNNVIVTLQCTTIFFFLILLWLLHFVNPEIQELLSPTKYDDSTIEQPRWWCSRLGRSPPKWKIVCSNPASTDIKTGHEISTVKRSATYASVTGP